VDADADADEDEAASKSEHTQSNLLSNLRSTKVKMEKEKSNAHTST
jgi:hypothetical protein